MEKVTAKDLTPGERKVLECLEKGMTFEETEKETGFAFTRKLAAQAIDKMDKSELLKSFPMIYMHETDFSGKELDREVWQTAKMMGIPEKLLSAVRRRLDAKTHPVKSDLSQLSDKQIIDVMREKLSLAFGYMDDFAFAGASAKDLAIVADSLINNIQLLSGKPTSITTIEDRRKINELIPALVEEAHKRGLVIEGQSRRVS